MRASRARIKVHFDANEVRMSHWILEPIVIRARDGATVLSLDGTGWDGGGRTPSFPARDHVELHLMHYPDGKTSYDPIVDVETERCWFAGVEDEPFATDQVEAQPEGAHERHAERTAPDLLAQGICPRWLPPRRERHCQDDRPDSAVHRECRRDEQHRLQRTSCGQRHVHRRDV